MRTYRNTHLWLLIPLLIAIVGFLQSYWLRFTQAPFRHHLHGLTATLWLVLLIVQPYLITRGHAAKHRLFGMLALIVAGGVVFSALNLIPYNLTNDFFPIPLRYGLSFIDIVLMIGFVVALTMAIVTSKNMDDHARWMISTVFWALSPGMFRLLFIPVFIFGTPNMDSTPSQLLLTAGLLNLSVLAVLMFKDKRAHPAYVSAAIGSLVLFIPLWVGNAQWWITLADAIFTS